MSSPGAANASDLGMIMRLSSLKASDLPVNPKLVGSTGESTADDGRPSLKDFIETALLEAHGFIDDMHAQNYPTTKTMKSPPSSAEVAILKKTVTADDLRTKAKWGSAIVPSRKATPLTRSEEWVARRSIHPSESKNGTASWEEFCTYLRSHHSEYEAEYTSDIYERKEIITWAPQIGELSFENLAEVEMELVEMNHKLPPPLNPRSFCTLVVSGNVTTDCFVVAQIPVDCTSLPSSAYSRSGKKTVRGMYVSIERCERQPNQDIVWTMATASDAGGNLPQFAQQLGIPGAIAKDVGLFFKWVDGKRGSTSDSAPQ